jgi:hypothetical protein
LELRTVSYNIRNWFIYYIYINNLNDKKIAETVKEILVNKGNEIYFDKEYLYYHEVKSSIINMFLNYKKFNSYNLIHLLNKHSFIELLVKSCNYEEIVELIKFLNENIIFIQDDTEDIDTIIDEFKYNIEENLCNLVGDIIFDKLNDELMSVIEDCIEESTLEEIHVENDSLINHIKMILKDLFNDNLYDIKNELDNKKIILDLDIESEYIVDDIDIYSALNEYIDDLKHDDSFYEKESYGSQSYNASIDSLFDREWD